MTGFLLEIDPNSTNLLGFILAGVTTIISILFGAMIQARNAQLKEKDTTLLHVVAAKDENIISKDKLITEAKKENETLQQQNIQLLAQIIPVLKNTQEVVKDTAQALREIARK